MSHTSGDQRRADIIAAVAQPEVKIGICQDFPLVEVWQPFLDGLQLAFEEAAEQHVLDRPVRLIIEHAVGLPTGNAYDVIQAWEKLVDAGCVAIIGPMISDNCIAVKQHLQSVERKVPVLTWSGTDRQYDEYIFGIGNGSLPEESYLLAEAIADRGLGTVAVVFDRAATGYEYHGYFSKACLREGLTIVYSEGVGQYEADLTGVVANVRARSPEALVYLGFGIPGMRMNSALKQANWDPPRYMSTAFINCYINDDWMRGLQGWIGVDQYDEDNSTGQRFQARFAERFGYRQENCVPTLAFDTGTILAHGIGNAVPLTPQGVMEGLQEVKALPAATGGPGTRLSLGRWNRRAWHGVNYLVLREITEDCTGTRLVGRFRQ